VWNSRKDPSGKISEMLVTQPGGATVARKNPSHASRGDSLGLGLIWFAFTSELDELQRPLLMVLAAD
jgi:hypothetical protein